MPNDVNASHTREYFFAYNAVTVTSGSRYLAASTADSFAAYPRWALHGQTTKGTLRVWIQTATWSGGGTFGLSVMKNNSAAASDVITFSTGATGILAAYVPVTFVDGDDVAIRLAGPGGENAATLAITGSLCLGWL